MRYLSSTLCNHILSLLDKGHSAHQISSTTGVSIASISRLHSKHCSTLSKSSGGCPLKLSSANIHHAICLIVSGKAEPPVEVSKTLPNIINQPPSDKKWLDS